MRIIPLLMLALLLAALILSGQTQARPQKSQATSHATKLVASPQLVADRKYTARVLHAVGALPAVQPGGDGMCDYELVKHLIQPAVEADGDVCYPISGQAELVASHAVWTSQASDEPFGPRKTVRMGDGGFWEAWITEEQQHNGNDDTIGIGMPDPSHPGEWLWNRVLFTLYNDNGQVVAHVWAPLGISRCASNLNCAAFWAANGLERTS